MKQIRVSLKERSYDILIGRGILRRIGSFLRRLTVGEKVMVVSNREVARHFGFLKPVRKSLAHSGFRVSDYELPFGNERDKSEKVLSRIWRCMIRSGLDRSSTLIALGGGVVGDVAGFAASTYMRGVHFIQVPTTLLAQVDSAIGGKTGVDLDEGKNMIGTFYQPRLVLSDVDTLGTLRPAVFQQSLAEVVKYGVIRDPALFSLLERFGNTFLSHAANRKFGKMDFSFLEKMIERSARIKADIVARDEKETKGERMILNYGHTFAHALEGASRFRMSHGEAVYIGMLLAGELGYRIGLTPANFVKRQARLIHTLFPQIRLPHYAKHYRFAWPKLKMFLGRDKKAVAGELKFILPAALGKVKVVTMKGRSAWRKVERVFTDFGFCF